MRSVGVDLGSRELSLCEVAGDDVVVRRTARSLEGLRGILGPGTEQARVAIEACREAWHVHDVLTRWGHDVLLVDTTKSRTLGIGRHGRKNDRIDAEVLARAVECNQVPEAHVLSPHRRELREMLLTRRALVEVRANLITTVRGIVRARGESLGGCDTENFRKKVHHAKLGPATREAIAPIVALLAPLDAQLAHVDAELDKLCAQEPVIAPLTTAPGVGLIVAAAFVSVVDEAKRFRHAHQLQSYLGLVPSEDTTGGRNKMRQLVPACAADPGELVHPARPTTRSAARLGQTGRQASRQANRRGRRRSTIGRHTVGNVAPWARLRSRPRRQRQRARTSQCGRVNRRQRESHETGRFQGSESRPSHPTTATGGEHHQMSQCSAEHGHESVQVSDAGERDVPVGSEHGMLNTPWVRLRPPSFSLPTLRPGHGGSPSRPAERA